EAESFRAELEGSLTTYALWIAPSTLLGLMVAAAARALRLPMPSAFFEGLDHSDESKTPELFFVTLALSVQLFGWLFATLLALMAFALAFVGARMIGLTPLVRRALSPERTIGAELARSLDV